MAAKQIFGIDLGTTYSCISHIDDNGKPVIVANFEGELTTPSVVHFESEENIVVGGQAKNSTRIYPDKVCSFVKRQMGDPTFIFEADGKSYRPEEISSFILRKLAKDASQAIGIDVKDVVITCPAYFGINEREATKNAGKLAGLTVHHILNEPTAAAICYGAVEKGDQVVLVYDFGGGTFDITLISIKDGDINVVYTDGNHSLGGKDLDDRIVNYMAEQFMEQQTEAGDPRDDEYSLQEITNAAEGAKKGLTPREKWPMMVTHDGKRARVELTREKLQELTADLLEQTAELTRQVIKEGQDRDCDHIDQVLLVGGSSKMPRISQILGEIVDVEPQLLDPDLAVAKGAALMGLRILAGELIREEIANEQGTNKEDVDLSDIDQSTLERAAQAASEKAPGIKLLPASDVVAHATGNIVNVCSKGFGVAVISDEVTMEREVTYLIHNNTAVPSEVTETGFGIAIANQTAVKVEVYEQAGQAESPDLDNNNCISEGEITGLPSGLPAGSPIHVTFRLEDDGTLKVTAMEPTSGQELQLEVDVEGVMSSDEVEQRKGLLLKKNIS